ncbi:DNA repair protein rad51d, variant 7 [Lathyrus oleraceus]|uniref:DNA repair protein rad51d, variant 7 n=1 Tax=Pisum sativum TaxID=3888 RepID=A0A9D4VVJ1_PEA|nr:DNA repair protein rad51d, variant 7 [Pisum sativum]
MLFLIYYFLVKSYIYRNLEMCILWVISGHALMVSVGFLLKKLAHEHNIAVLVTNHVVGGEDGNSKPALGESWKSVPHVRLLLSRECGGNACNISIIKHPAMASGRTATSTRLFV